MNGIIKTIFSPDIVMDQTTIELCRMIFNFSDSDDAEYVYRVELGHVVQKEQRYASSPLPFVFRPQQYAERPIEFNPEALAAPDIRNAISRLAENSALFTSVVVEGARDYSIEVGETPGGVVENGVKYLMEEDWLLCQNWHGFDARHAVVQCKPCQAVANRTLTGQVIAVKVVTKAQIELLVTAMRGAVQRLNVRNVTPIRDAPPETIQNIVLGVQQVIELLK